MAVTLINDSEFDQQLAGKKIVVKYFADWCGSCRLFTPKFRRLSEDDLYKSIVFVDVDAEKNPESRKKGQVNSLPSFAIFNDGKLEESVATSKEEVVVELL